MITKKLYLYENRDDVFLTTYLWESSLELPAGKRRPLVLICPGGGYLNCSDREAEPVALRFASMGYHAAVLRYSTYGERRDDFARLDTDDFVKPHVLYPAQLRELGMAMLLLRRHAEAWRIDSDRIAICGFSAGANNCALYAANWNKPLLTEVLDARPEQLRPFAVLLSYAVADFSNTEGVKEEELKLYEYMCKAFLGSEEPTREQFDRVNPSLLIDADSTILDSDATNVDRREQNEVHGGRTAGNRTANI